MDADSNPHPRFGTINAKDEKSGKIEIEYYSQDELDRIIDLIRTIQ